MRTLILVLMMGMVGCASTPKLSAEEQSVKVLRGSYSLEGCKPVASLKEYLPISYSSDVANPDLAGDYLKRAALKFGANTVVQIGNAQMGDTAYGRAYICK